MRDIRFRILAMPDESFCIFHPALHAAKMIHGFMKGPEVRFRMLAGVGETCSMLAA